MRRFILPVAALALFACKTDPEPNESDGSSSSTTTDTDTATGSESATTSGDGDAGDGDGDGDGDGTSGGTTGGGVPDPVDCGNQTYECGDGIDNDNDGLIDSYDPECTGPCDDDEGTFATGIPGDNMDCWQDCFFDGNSGQGGGDCRWNLTCDPANPGANIGCEYNPNGNCANQPPDTSQSCLDQCSGLTPNGCDCFGCCEVDIGGGQSLFIFLNSGGECSLENLGACQQCTQVEECTNPCVDEDCELCFGEDELPPGCTTPTCPAGQEPCQMDNPEEPPCPGTLYCISGCCVDFAPPD
jgi:hypothetical protein